MPYPSTAVDPRLAQLALRPEQRALDLAVRRDQTARRRARPDDARPQFALSHRFHPPLVGFSPNRFAPSVPLTAQQTIKESHFAESQNQIEFE